MFKKKTGFTLIELIVVIAIISILMTLGVAYLSTSRKKSQDARKITEFREFQTAINLYWDTTKKMPGNYHIEDSTMNLLPACDDDGPEKDNYDNYGTPAINPEDSVLVNETYPELSAFAIGFKPLVDLEMLPNTPKSPGGAPYCYFNYYQSATPNTSAGFIISTYLATAEDSTEGNPPSKRFSGLSPEMCNAENSKEYCFSIKY